MFYGLEIHFYWGFLLIYYYWPGPIRKNAKNKTAIVIGFESCGWNEYAHEAQVYCELLPVQSVTFLFLSSHYYYYFGFPSYKYL